MEVNHTANEYVRGDVHTNTVEGYFSIFKRGMKGVYQHCSEKYLRAKLGVDDTKRTDRTLRGIVGKRLTYRRIGGAGLIRSRRSAVLSASRNAQRKARNSNCFPTRIWATVE